MKIYNNGSVIKGIVCWIKNVLSESNEAFVLQQLICVFTDIDALFLFSRTEDTVGKSVQCIFSAKLGPDPEEIILN